ncbi:hypothetical protein [uncultured Winogradskyella sp.]|uniref:hypothetical protein n=1 Tax=uncultured Winogradskyella sp. TaxID=395353 RepID=UPI00260C5944|nr:hypothetical protein [uncultured Winogradskyella sp.]
MTLRYTTPVANVFFDSLMQQLSSSAIRVYLKIARNTNGWRNELGQVKKRDWIAHSQFGKVGVSPRSVTTAVEELLSLELIHVTDEQGNSLHDPQKRKRAKRIYYGLIDQTQAQTAFNSAQNHKNKTQFQPTTKESSTKEKYNVNERLTDKQRMQQILQNEEEKQIKRDDWL